MWRQKAGLRALRDCLRVLLEESFGDADGDGSLLLGEEPSLGDLGLLQVELSRNVIEISFGSCRRWDLGLVAYPEMQVRSPTPRSATSDMK